jgi:hypothetical protein
MAKTSKVKHASLTQLVRRARRLAKGREREYIFFIINSWFEGDWTSQFDRGHMVLLVNTRMAEYKKYLSMVQEICSSLHVNLEIHP